VTEIHAEKWRLEPGGWIESQYDVPPDAWYFRANRQRTMPFSVLLEAALQPCGWLAAYLGSALHSEHDLHFRNLGGQAVLHEEITPDAGTLTVRVRLTKCTQAGDTLLQEYDMQIWQHDRLAYDGQTSFGFFTSEALAQQVGVRGAAQRRYQPTPADRARGERFALDDARPLTPDDPEQTPGPPAALPARAYRMIDRVDLLTLDGGPHGLGLVRGVKEVDPAEWFFKAHFYQDPVWPGSLGLEALIQLLKLAALRRWPALEHTHRFEPIATGTTHRWLYRGQVIPTNRVVEADAAIRQVSDGPEPLIAADGFLTVDGTTIYEMTDFALRLVKA